MLDYSAVFEAWQDALEEVERAKVGSARMSYALGVSRALGWVLEHEAAPPDRYRVRGTEQMALSPY